MKQFHVLVEIQNSRFIVTVQSRGKHKACAKVAAMFYHIKENGKYTTVDNPIL